MHTILRSSGRHAPLAAALLGLAAACSDAGGCPDPFAPGCWTAAEREAPPRSLVFNSNRLGPAEIFTAHADGTEWIRLTNNTGADMAPHWSPDGTRIAWASTREGAREIWVMNADGSGQRQVTSLNASAFMPDWSPDGTRLVFQARRGSIDENAWDIWVVNADGSGLQRLTSAASQVDPRWSPDGRQIAVRWMESSSDGSCRCLGSNPVCACPSRIALLAVADGSVQQLPRVGTSDFAPAWSPDGRHIVFASYRSEGPGMPSSRIMIMNADGTRARPVSNDGLLDDWYPSWSVATDRIYFVRAYRIYSVRPDGTGLRRSTATPTTDVYVHSR
jgi:Tol biopolymer transport system component